MFYCQHFPASLCPSLCRVTVLCLALREGAMLGDNGQCGGRIVHDVGFGGVLVFCGERVM